MSTTMFAHHEEAIARMVTFFKKDKTVLAVLVAGSLAHGYAREDSDVDLLIVLDDEAYEKKRAKNKLTFLHLKALTAARYKGGYIDGKFTCPRMMRLTSEKGSDAARYAYKDAKIAFSRMEGLPELLAEITRYPEQNHALRLKRFAAQFEAWNWYVREGLKKNDEYLVRTAIQKMILFGCRLILAHNRQLYPYHKWLLREVAGCEKKPKDIMSAIERLYDEPGLQSVDNFYKKIRKFGKWPVGIYEWPRYFMADSELNWLDGEPPIDDV